MIDSHCHLAGTEFVDDLRPVVDRARVAGVQRVLVILAADEDDEIERATNVTDAWPEVRFAVGVHPHAAHRFAADPERAATVVASRLTMAGVCAVGEIGLDYHYDFSPPEVQQAVFRAQLRVARDRRLPVVLHVREAEADVLRILEDEGAGRGLHGVFHCFSGDTASAARALATGFYLSIPGIVTFPKAAALRDAAASIPEDRVLIETDSPYLAPVPHRGKRNEPAYVARTLDAVAHARGVSPAQLGAALVANFDRLFGLP